LAAELKVRAVDVDDLINFVPGKTYRARNYPDDGYYEIYLGDHVGWSGGWRKWRFEVVAEDEEEKPKVKKVRCIDNRYYAGQLTLGKVYDVTSEDDDWLRITSDDGMRNAGYRPDRFEVVEDEPEVPVKDTQVGGDHYSKLAIQPYEYCLANNLGGLELNVIKYVTRWKDKGGVEDLKKARHTLDYLIEYLEKQAKSVEKDTK
jgi:hypothetical protein